MDISHLKYPKKSHRKRVILPKRSALLAELFGIILGDGEILNDWQFRITVNSIADLEYSRYISWLIKHLFQIETSIKKVSTRNALRIFCNSTTIVDFLLDNGLVRGNKITNQVDIPIWIKNNSEYSRNCVRGLVDTDGCLYTHKHIVTNKVYNNIGFCYASTSRNLLNSCAAILSDNTIKPHATKKGTMIYLYSAKEIEKYLAIFGTSNPRIQLKYNQWRVRLEA